MAEENGQMELFERIDVPQPQVKIRPNAIDALREAEVPFLPPGSGNEIMVEGDE